MKEQNLSHDFTIDGTQKIREYDNIRVEVSDEAFWAGKDADSLHIIQEQLRKLLKRPIVQKSSIGR